LQKKGIGIVEYTNCINFLLTIAQHEVFLVFSETLSQFGITPGQYGVLACLWKDETLTPKEIAAILRVENSTISGVLDRMQKRGFIDRVLDPNNKRSIRVKATEKGLAIKEPVQKKIEELNQFVLHDFSPDEQRNLLNYLSRIGKIQHSDP
jgi:DNA-binding MarR family transcriptional regulator